MTVALTPAVSPPAPPQGLPEPIPLAALFGNADKRLPRLSADGKFYAYLADDAAGVANVFVKPVLFETESPKKHGLLPHLHAPAPAHVLIDAVPQQVTFEDHRPVRYFVWSKSLTTLRLFYLQDDGGNENFHLYCVDFETDQTTHRVVQDTLRIRDLTPFENVTVTPDAVQMSKEFPATLVVSLNKRDPRFFDAYRLNVLNGDLEVIMQNPGDVASWLLNDAFEVAGCSAMNPKDGSTSLRMRPSLDNTDAATWKTIALWPHGEMGEPLLMTKDGKGVYVQTSISHVIATSAESSEQFNTERLVLLSSETGEELEVIASDPLCDVHHVEVNENTRTVEFVTFNYTKQRIEVVDESLKVDLDRLTELCTGNFNVVSTSDDNLTWIYSDSPDNASLKYYIYSRTSGRFALLFDTRPDLAQYTMVHMKPHVIKTTDDEDMIVYVSLPHGVEPKGLPFVLCAHGGPWARDNWNFNPTHQFFANRGYGCISVNFRGSTGLGKRWTNLGDQQWGATMQQDLTDAVEWIIKQGYADKDRVGIYGGSYGGYAVLAGLAFTPDVYACGVDIVGPSNAATLLASIPPYWEPMKKMLQLRVGDVENDPALNERISPLYHADKICKPLLIGQGANDPRVKQAESDQIAKKLYANKHEVTYILYPDEGHGFARPANKLDFTSRVEQFFAQHLGGRALPKDEKLTAGNSAVEVDVTVL